MNKRIIINGAKGKMGKITVKTLSFHPEFSIVSCPSKDDNLEQIIKDHHADIVVDFTNAQSVLKNLTSIIKAGAHPVIGTSGLKEEDIRDLQSHCKKHKIGGIIAPNFSIGAVLMMKYAEKIAVYFPQVEILEMHHAGKLDSPSGTAIRTAELIAKSRSMTHHPSSESHKTRAELRETTTPTACELTTEIRETIPGARGAHYQNIPIHAIRLPGFLASQQVIFGNHGETLTLKHDTIDRECFMPGVILACQKVLALDELVYGLEHLL